MALQAYVDGLEDALWIGAGLATAAAATTVVLIGRRRRDDAAVPREVALETT